MSLPFAGIAQLVEHDLAKVGVASSNLVSRSNFSQYGWVAEWLCSGLQSRVQRFDSAPSLHIKQLLTANQEKLRNLELLGKHVAVQAFKKKIEVASELELVSRLVRTRKNAGKEIRLITCWKLSYPFPPDPLWLIGCLLN